MTSREEGIPQISIYHNITSFGRFRCEDFSNGARDQRPDIVCQTFEGPVDLAAITNFAFPTGHPDLHVPKPLPESRSPNRNHDWSQVMVDGNESYVPLPERRKQAGPIVSLAVIR